VISVGGVALAAAVAAVPAGAAADTTTSPFGHHRAGEEFTQTNLVSDIPGQAQLLDASLKNPWGIAMGPATPIWFADNNAGVATLYSVPPGGGSVSKVKLTVNVPGGRADDGPSPTGQVFNGTSGFVLTTPTGSGPARFIFVSESGQLTAWAPGVSGLDAQLMYSSPTGVYKGLAIATGDDGTFLYATNFHDGTVDVFDSSFNRVWPAGGFVDHRLPEGYAPFGIQNLNGLIYVSYAKQNDAKHDDVAGQGHGFIDVFTSNGFLVDRLVSRGELDSPWGMTIAPSGFGRFGGALLVGNFGNGRINAYDPFSGRFLGELLDWKGEPLAIDGLWGLTFGTAGTGGTGTLLFGAGSNGEQDGLFGSINPLS
jgi:uncharacterized protein (TIGR03118 family)